MRSLLRTALLLLAACADEPDTGIVRSEVVVNPTVGGPFGSLETCSSAPVVVAANGEVPKGATMLMDNAAANWGHTNAPETFAAASTGGDGLGASKWYRGAGRTATKALLVYWNNATQCAYVVPNTATSCEGRQCDARSLDTTQHVYRKYAALALEDGVLGMPISNPIRFNGTGVTYQLFTNGVITYDATYGAHYAGGPEPEARALARGWMRAFGVSTTAGPAAYPFMEDASCTSTRSGLGNCTQDGGKNGRYAKVFDRGAQLPAYFLARTGWTESYAVWGNYVAEWMRIAGPQPWNTHGFPLADPRTTPTGEQYIPLEHGALFRTSSGAALLANDQYASWSAHPDELGAPTASESSLDGYETVQTFANGNLYRSARGTIFGVPGGTNPTLAAYLAAGGPAGSWGFPVEDGFSSSSVSRAIRGQRFGRGLFVFTGDTVGTFVPDDLPTGTSFDLRFTSVAPEYTSLAWTNLPGEIVERVMWRSVDDGPFEAIIHLPSSETTMSDLMPPSDRKICYQLHVIRTPNPPTATNTACHFTPSTRPRNQTVNRLVVAIRTSTKPDAQTQHRVRVRLQAPEYSVDTRSPKGNTTWVDTPSNNFQRGTTSTFDLNTTKISDLADITQLAIEVEGDDELCVAGVELLADNVRVFGREFGDNTCERTQLVGKPGGRRVLVANYDELRADPDWARYNTVLDPLHPDPNAYPPVRATLGVPFQFIGYTKEQFIEKVNGLVGHALLDEASDPQGQAFYPRFEGQPTTTHALDASTLAVYPHVQVDDDFIGQTHCQLAFKLKLVPDQNKTRIDVSLDGVSTSCWQTGPLGWIQAISPPFGIVTLINYLTQQEFDEKLEELTYTRDPPAGARYCFGATNAPLLFAPPRGDMDADCFSACTL